MRASLLLAILLLSGAAWADPVEDAQQALAQGDFAKAARSYTLAAKKGDGDAQYNLAVMYFNGQGVTEDRAEALKWFKKAAGHKVVESYYYLGFLYDEGGSVPADPAEAARWYALAADKGDAKAQRRLARLYQEGLGVAQDSATALTWYRAAGDKGDAEAQFNAGAMYEAGQGVARDYAEASRWYGLAVQGGHPKAQGRVDKLKVLVAQDQLIQIQQHVTQSSTAQAVTTAPVQQPAAQPQAQDDKNAWGPERWAAVGAGLLALLLVPTIVVLRRKAAQKAPPPPPAPRKKVQPAPAPGFRPIDDQTLLRAVNREIDVLQHSRHYISGGSVPVLVNQCEGKPPEFCSAYAAAFLKLNNYQGALDLLQAKGSLSPDDYAVYMAAQFKLGRLDMLEPAQIPETGKAAFATALMEAGKDAEARETLFENRQPSSAADAAAVLRLALRAGEFTLAEKTLETLPSPEAAPELHYYAGLLCEKNGRLDKAQGFFSRIPRFKDAAGRLRRLRALDDFAAKQLAAVMEVFTSTPETPLTRAFSEHFVGRYELSRPLGMGSTGMVYKGSDRAVTRDAAVKRFPPELAADAQARALFLAQAGLAVKVSSPYLAVVYDAISVDDGLFLASAHVDGESLSEILASRGRFSPRKLIPHLRSACEGVVAAHEGKVIHGNIKPSNILLDRKGLARVTDLGFSQLAGKRYEGMPYYGAPELVSGAPTVQSDIYSMGLAACELLTGEAPALGDPTYVERFAANKEIPAADSGKALHEAVLDCLKPDPAARYKTMGQLMSRLQGIF